MIVKPMFREPAEVRLSKSETTVLAKAVLYIGQLELTRPDLQLEGVVHRIETAVAKLAEEGKKAKKPEEKKPEPEKAKR